MNIFKLSQIFQPRFIIPPGKEKGAEINSLSQKLLSHLGLVRQNDGGTNILLPIALRAVSKLEKLIRTELELYGAQEIALPSLTPHRLFQETGRGELPELFILKDRNKKSYVLSPTHEEAVVSLMASIKPSYKQLPLVLFQITSKFRDEIKPRFGLMRSREFIMKDAYSFNTTPEAALSSYNKMNDCYRRIFEKLEIPFKCVEGSTGEIGGTVSHEFHVLTNVGEDRIRICSDCGYGTNDSHQDITSSCKQCKGANVSVSTAIEVGHSFLLGTRYSKPLKAFYTASDNSQTLLEMSCHGIGLSRLLAAGVEVLSEPNKIQWPRKIAPFSVCIIPPKAGSKEEQTSIAIERLHSQIAEMTGNDVVLDDRTEQTIGKRLSDATAMGYPFIVIVGKAALESPPRVEIHDTCLKTCQVVAETEVNQVLNQIMNTLP